MEGFLRIILSLLGGILGYQAADYLRGLQIDFPFTENYLIVIAVSLGALVGLAISPLFDRMFRCLLKLHMRDILSGLIGLVCGILIAILVSIPLQNVKIANGYLPLIITTILAVLGWSIGVKKREEVVTLFQKQNTAFLGNRNGVCAKILDTSVIIDGRISDITKTGFIEGTLIVPSFVLDELQHIADSSDVLKRNRGRRGLDILNKIQKEPYVAVQILDRNFDDISEVDSKLVKLAKELGAKVITNDFNLNKVCELHGVQVLNINELANAVKPVVLPGEELRVHVIKDGKEQGQGVAYLDDGTMIVVDGGRRYIGETIGVMVTSVLQTAAGRMIFAKPKAMEKAL
ncbi:MAG TPA: PIN/TRAM domain-containing protein [Limnochordia bacterium]|nr:PIN/TRAM domain-containing protein [Limnochordia bacterium]